MKILVTGGTGYIGSHAVVELIENGYEVEILDNLFNSKATVLDKIEEITGVRSKFHEVDLLDSVNLKKVFAEGKFDAVMHFAGLKAVAESSEKPLLYYENNVVGTINLIKAMHEYGVKKIIFSSSACVYGIQDSVKYNEEMKTGYGIFNPYGRTKYMIEEIIKDVAAADPEFCGVLLRYFNPIGAHRSGLIGEDPNDIPNNLMPIITKVYRGEIPALSVFGDDYDTPDGTCIRDYIHVMDLVKGHVAVLNGMKSGVATYNLGTGKGTSVMEIIKAFDKVAGVELPYKIADRRAGDLAEYFADPAKINREYGWSAEMTIEDAVRDVLNYLNHLEQ